MTNRQSTRVYHLDIMSLCVCMYIWMTCYRTPSTFARLGAGTFGTVFAWSSTALKQVACSIDTSRLLQEYSDLETIYAATVPSFGKCVVFLLPQPRGFYHSYWEFAKEMHLDCTSERGLTPQALYAMQLVEPVPRSLAAEITHRFFPAHEQHRGVEPPAFLARLYIGAIPRPPRAQGMPVKNVFSPLNFPLTALMMEELTLPVAAIAEAMGRTLAAINFLLGADGRDIEFVLGGDPADPLRKPGYACIDFNQLRQHSGNANVIVDAWIQNDPFYPRPASAYWVQFETGYLEVATLAGQRPLASCVIQGIQSAFPSELSRVHKPSVQEH